ncbi:hypothetical protein RRG08_059889 [Elysia crispata]|uniref:Uncharacterized protein n=1 Tax=Elysia crispata TaxID=231223 RepID=A0AAE0ZH28_9GAST|nr:hypothetical protein RRG08_059889 [Elysia crispata]
MWNQMSIFASGSQVKFSEMVGSYEMYTNEGLEEIFGNGEILCESMKQMKILTSEGSDKISEMVGSGENIHLYSVERQMKFLEIEGSDKNVYESRDQMKM